MGVLEGYALSFAGAWAALLVGLWIGRLTVPGWRAMLGMTLPAALLGGLIFLGLGEVGLIQPDDTAGGEDPCAWPRRSLACDTGDRDR